MPTSTMEGASKKNTQTVLITGASSGIGEAFALRFAREGLNLILVARNAGKLDVLAQQLRADFGINVRVEVADLSRSGSAKRIASSLKRSKITVDILVNNAGVLEQGAFIDMTAERHQELIALNVSGLTAMLAHFVAPMVERGQGRILNVASIAAFQPVPTLATYAATKAYVLSITESLSEELKGTGVTITALCPGITATNMMSAAKRANGRLAKLPSILVGQAEQVADEGFQACMQGDVIRVPGTINLMASLAGRASPKWLLRRITGSLGRKTLAG